MEFERLDEEMQLIASQIGQSIPQEDQ